MADPWNPERYGRFRAERERPFEDLLGMVREAGVAPRPRVLDLGCGTGALTARLHRELGARTTLGVDRSWRMLGEARPHGSGSSRGSGVGPGFLCADLEVPPLDPGARFDLVFSNAALHWVDGHAALLERLCTRLAPSGLLAVQVPSNDEHPSHALAAEVAGEEPFREALGGWTCRSPVLAPEEYARLLVRLGLEEVRVRREVYLHLMPEAAAVVDWTRGTLLNAYRERLPAGLFERFLERYAERVRAVLGDERPFVYPFLRTLFVGRGSYGV